MSGLRIEELPDQLVVTLDRPEKRNAIDADLIAELHEVCAELEARPRLLLLTSGTEGIFAGGADIGSWSATLRKKAPAASLRRRWYQSSAATGT